VAICADSDVPQTLRKQAQEIGADLWCIGTDFGFTRHDGQWDYRSNIGSRSAMPYPALRGAFQLHNASAALAALDAVKDSLPVNMQAVRRGLSEVKLAGRFQFVPGQPQLILDVGHNPHAARSLAQNLANLPPAKTFAVFSMLKDKDIESVVRALDAQIDIWMVAGIDAPRGAETSELVQVLQDAQVHGVVKPCKTITDALHEASNHAGENDRIVAFGSFYTVAEVMRVRGLRGG
jgi:dihydrofolate synthase/folylpolyglutamate synthase